MVYLRYSLTAKFQNDADIQQLTSACQTQSEAKLYLDSYQQGDSHAVASVIIFPYLKISELCQN